MKKVLYLTGTFLLITGMTYAQGDVHFGLKGGVNVSNLSSSPDMNYESKIGFHAGALAHIHLSKAWALQPEIMYSAQGAKLNDATANINYFNIPVQLQYMFDKGFRLQTGPQLGVLAGAKVKQNDVKTDVSESFKSFEFGWTLGASYVFPSGVGLDARYNLGISKINDGGAVDLSNRNFQAGIFYVFGHKYK